MKVLNEQKIEIDRCKATPTKLRELFEIMDTEEISGKIAKEVFKEMVATGDAARIIIDEKSLKQLTDKEQIISVINDVLRENEKVVIDFKGVK